MLTSRRPLRQKRYSVGMNARIADAGTKYLAISTVCALFERAIAAGQPAEGIGQPEQQAAENLDLSKGICNKPLQHDADHGEANEGDDGPGVARSAANYPSTRSHSEDGKCFAGSYLPTRIPRQSDSGLYSGSALCISCRRS